MKYDRLEDVRMGDLVITSDVDVFSDKIGIVLEPITHWGMGRVADPSIVPTPECRWRPMFPAH